VTLSAGITFISELGVYLIGKFKVKYKDILLVKEERELEILIGRRVTRPWDP
jgi:Xaa-Pro aminopeptidase